VQRTYSKFKLRQFGEDIDPIDFDSDLCFFWRLCAFAVEVLIPTLVFHHRAQPRIQSGSEKHGGDRNKNDQCLRRKAREQNNSETGKGEN
jgi:hypothetical protein